MTSAAKIFGKRVRIVEDATSTINWKLPQQYIGVEIEVEDLPGTVWPEEWFPYWDKKRDGSLRSGSEFVLVEPLKGGTLAKAIHALLDNSTFQRSVTGSTHIHVDMTEESTTGAMIQTLTLMIYALESVIFRRIGTGREWSGYTNTLASAPEALLGLALNATADNGYADLVRASSNGDIGRYYGLNIAALGKFGSVEFRYFPTATSVEELTDWIQMMQSFKKAAVEVGTPTEFARIVADADLYERFINTYFAEWAGDFLRDIPHYMAYSMVKKALAIAAMYRSQQETPYRFDSRAITGNKKVASKWLKNKPPAHTVGDVLIVASTELAAQPSQHPRGTVMFYSGQVYVNTVDGWERSVYDMAEADMRSARDALGAAGVGTSTTATTIYAESLRQRLAAAGSGPSRIASFFANATDMMVRLVSAVGPYVPNVSTEEEDEDAPEEAAPPAPRAHVAEQVSPRIWDAAYRTNDPFSNITAEQLAAMREIEVRERERLNRARRSTNTTRTIR